MTVDYKFYVGFKDINQKLQLKNSSMLTFFENVAGIHASMVGDGLKETITTTHTTWLLLSWKVRVFSRPEHGESVIARTWVKDFKRVYSYREFELLSESGEVLAVCATKWVKIDFEKGLPARHAVGLDRYDTEDKTNFAGDGAEVKLAEPQEHKWEFTYKVPLDWIDMNYHMNNTRYLTLAQYAFAENGLEFPEFNSFEVMYKKEVKFGETLKCLVSEDAEGFTVAVKSRDESLLHTLLRFCK